jgi:hypothetical protein
LDAQPAVPGMSGGPGSPSVGESTYNVGMVAT